jgi:hypothetical protein
MGFIEIGRTRYTALSQRTWCNYSTPPTRASRLVMGGWSWVWPSILLQPSGLIRSIEAVSIYLPWSSFSARLYGTPSKSRERPKRNSFAYLKAGIDLTTLMYVSSETWARVLRSRPHGPGVGLHVNLVGAFANTVPIYSLHQSLNYCRLNTGLLQNRHVRNWQPGGCSPSHQHFS